MVLEALTSKLPAAGQDRGKCKKGAVIEEWATCIWLC